MEILASRLVLRPSDHQRSLEFYRDTLGLRIFQEFGSGLRAGEVFFLGGGYLELVGQAECANPPGLVLWLQVPNLAEARAELLAKGVTISREAAEEPWGLWEMHIHDPDGTLIQLVEVPVNHSIRHGFPAPPFRAYPALEAQIASCAERTGNVL